MTSITSSVNINVDVSHSAYILSKYRIQLVSCTKEEDAEVVADVKDEFVGAPHYHRGPLAIEKKIVEGFSCDKDGCSDVCYWMCFPCYYLCLHFNRSCEWFSDLLLKWMSILEEHHTWRLCSCWDWCRQPIDII